MKRLIKFVLLVLISSFSIGVGFANEDIVIVGGGLAGLTAAYRLKQAGISSTVYEGRERLGGRVYTHYYGDGSYVEVGGERIDADGSHQEIVDLVDELGLDLVQEGLPSFLLKYKGGGVDFGDLLIELESYREAVMGAFAADFGIRIKNCPTIIDLIDRNVPDNELVNSYLKIFLKEQEEQNLDVLPYDNYKESFEYAFSMAYYAFYLEKFPAILGALVNGSNYVGLTGYLLDWANMNHLFQYKVKGGVSLLIDGMAEKIGLENINLGHKLVAIDKKGELYRLRFSVEGGEEEVFAKKVVLTMPLTTLRDVAGLDELEGISEYTLDKINTESNKYMTHSKIIIPIKNAIWEEKGASTLLGMDLDNGTSIWDSSYGQQKSSITLFFSNADMNEPAIETVISEEKIDEIVASYEKLGFQRDHDREVIVHSWKHDEFSKGSYGYWIEYVVEESEKFPGILKYAEPIDGSLYLGGEHTVVKSAFLNSGVESGNFIAKEIAKVVGEGNLKDEL